MATAVAPEAPPARTPRRGVLALLHTGAGLAGVLLFVISGQYMDIRWDHLEGMADGPRMVFRANHIYLLFAALLNLGVGSYLTPRAALWARALQGIGSAFLLGALVLLGVAFWTEAPVGAVERPLTRLAVYWSLAGGLAHFAAGWESSMRRS